MSVLGPFLFVMLAALGAITLLGWAAEFLSSVVEWLLGLRR